VPWRCVADGNRVVAAFRFDRDKGGGGVSQFSVDATDGSSVPPFRSDSESLGDVLFE